MGAIAKERADKPAIEEFRLGPVIGRGNFSHIVQATHSITDEVFALKVVEKDRVKRMCVRHPNILNEIHMEKQVLNRLRHPNIIRLYQTFQDDVRLFFLLEYYEGGELLDQLIDQGRQLGLHEDLAKFYLVDLVNAIAHMHANGVVHRDLKPENVVLSKEDGHARVIDFGTAKDLLDTSHNGPNFVGTPEYMPPETIDNQPATEATDLWALGSIIYQLFTGETPFAGGSPYLTFLKTQSGSYHIPQFVPSEAKDLITKLLTPDPTKRLTIFDVKSHAFFHNVDFDKHMTQPKPDVRFPSDKMLVEIKNLKELEDKREETKPLTTFNDSVQEYITNLNETERERMMHLLNRQQLLHLPGIYPRFFPSPSQGRCRYAARRGYVGYSHALQNGWEESPSFMIVPGPSMGQQDEWDDQVAAFRCNVQVINEKRPAFVLITGDFFHPSSPDAISSDQISALQTILNEIQPETKLVFIPGSNLIDSPESSSVETYVNHFGDDYYSFWVAGVKFIVLNSFLIRHEEKMPEQSKQQHEWFRKEVENGELTSRATVVCSYHSLTSLSNNTSELPSNISTKYLDVCLRSKVCLIISGDGDNQVSSLPLQDACTEKECQLVRCSTLQQFQVSGQQVDLVESNVKAVESNKDMPEDSLLAPELVNLQLNEA